MEYSGIKVMWRLLLLECICLFASSFFEVWLTDSVGISLYASMIPAQLHMLIPIIIGGVYLTKNYRYYTFSNMIGLCGFDPIILLPTIFLPYASENFGMWMVWPYIETLTGIFGEQAAGITAPETVRELLLMISVLCVIVPITEEMLFRGILFKILEPYGTLSAIFITAFGFSILHFSPPVFVLILVVGAVLGFLRVCSGSLFPCMIFHALFNFLSVMQIVFQNELTSFEIPLSIMSIAGAVILPVLIFIVYKVWGKGKFHAGVIKRIKGGTVSLILILILYALMAINLAAMNSAMPINFGGGIFN